MKRKGFTFLELLLVLLVVGLLTAASTPAFKTFVANWRLQSGAKLVLSLLWEVQADAVANNRNSYLVVATTNGTWSSLQYKALKIVHDVSTGGYMTLYNWEYLPKGLQINSDPDVSTILKNTISIPYPNENGPYTSVGCVQFKPNGATTTSGTIRIEQADDPSKYKEVTYDLYSGRAKIQ